MAIPLMALMAIPSLIKGAVGGAQYITGANLNPKRPAYEIPQEEKDALGIAKNVASMRETPGYRQALEENKSLASGTTSQMLEAAQDPNSIMSNLSKITAGTMDQSRKLSAANDAFWLNNQSALRGALSRFGQFKDKQWQLNELEPYKDTVARKSSDTQAGLTNIMTGVSELSALPITAKRMEAMDVWTKKMGGVDTRTEAEKYNDFIKQAMDLNKSTKEGLINYNPDDYQPKSIWG